VKISTVVLGLLIAGTTTALYLHQDYRRDANANARLKIVHVEELKRRYQAEVENDRLQHDAEKVLWDSPIGLAQQRVLIAQELDGDLVAENQASQRGDPPDPEIALERAALARIDARLQELQHDATAATMKDQTP
jgi:hypothetical protein